jgi:hypothetical protein
VFHFTFHHTPQHHEVRGSTITRPEDFVSPRSQPCLVDFESRTLKRPQHRPADANPDGMPPTSLAQYSFHETRAPSEPDRGEPDRGCDVSAVQRDERPQSDQNQLAVLALHDPGGDRPDEPYGLAGFSPQETLGALSLGKVSASSAHSITRLSPREGLAALGLVGP